MDQTEAEHLLRAHADDTVSVPVLYDKERAAIVFVLGELEQLRAQREAVLAVLDQDVHLIDAPALARIVRTALRYRPVVR